MKKAIELLKINKLLPSCWFSQKKPTIQEDNPDIWKRLGIEILRDQIQTSSLKGQESEMQFGAAKIRLSDSINSLKDYVQQHKEILQEQLNIFEMTPDQLIQELQRLRKTVQQKKYEEADANSFTTLYKGLIQLSKKSNNSSSISITLVMEFLIRFNSILPQMNKAYTQPNILDTHPSKYEQVWKRVKFIPLNEQQIEKGYEKYSKIMHTVIGILLSSQPLQNGKLKFAYNFVRKSFSYQKEILRSLLIFRDAPLQQVKLMNSLEEGKLASLMQLSFPKIETNKVIYIPSRGNFGDNLDIFAEKKKSIPVRILYNKPLPKENQPIEEAFYHIHGGGFVLFSSFISQNYTRYLARQSNMLFFSIDYKLAPKHPFPEAVYDCLQVYRFLTEQAHKYLKVNLKRIYVGGDSAGGSLTCSLTALLLKQRLRLPNSLFLIFPSLDIRKIFYPSRVHNFTDTILWPSFINTCIDAYIQKEGDEHHPLASPIFITEQFVGGKEGDTSFPKNWPRTYITVGTKDPLRDESLLFMQKMTQAGINCECRLFQELRHGFMSQSQSIGEIKVAFKHSVDIIKEMSALAKHE